MLRRKIFVGLDADGSLGLPRAVLHGFKGRDVSKYVEIDDFSAPRRLSSGVVSIDEFEAAYAKLEEQLQAAAKAKAKGKAGTDHLQDVMAQVSTSIP